MDISMGSARGRWFAENLKSLRERECKFTSRATFDYNCVGFAVGDIDGGILSNDVSIIGRPACLETSKLKVI